jgi:DNA-binding transcriptional ArsR family regulator
MEMDIAIKRLSAIAQEARLEVFRLLVKAGPDGTAAGDIARSLGIPANTLSAQLLVLSNAGLVRARREGRSIIYAISFEAMRDLLVFLTEDCCGGRAEMCAPLAALGAGETECCDTPIKGAKHEAPARARRGR